jgi:ATP adenylyltransferase
MTSHLWAPWRMEYIRSGKSGGCFFCDYWRQPAADRDNLVLGRSRSCMVVMNRYPYNGGHLMIAPAAHVARLGLLEDGPLTEMIRLARLAEKVLDLRLRPQGFNVGLNLGRTAGAGVDDHLHLHVVPRWDGDTNFMPVLDDTRVVPVALTELWELLAPDFRAEAAACS